MARIAQLPERGVRAFDELQVSRWWLAQPIAAVRKYADDRGSSLAGLVTFQVFVGMLPLLVVGLTLLGRIAEGSERLRESLLDTTFGQFPVIGARLRDDVSNLTVSGPWLVVAIAGLLWTAAGMYHSIQLALNQVWNVPGLHRQGFASRHARALVLFVLFFVAAIGTSVVPAPDVGGPRLFVDALSALVGAAIAGVILLVVFRITVAPEVPLRYLVTAATLAGLLWQLLQMLGTFIVTRHLAGAGDLYGTIGLVVVLLAWINLLARSAVLANEWAVVSWRKLWPRRIAQPPFTDADRQVLEALVRNERRRPEEHIDVRFDDAADEGVTPPRS